MATTARRSVVGIPQSARGGNPDFKNRDDEEVKDFADDEYDENAGEQDSEHTRIQKRLVQMQYLEQEN